MYVEIEEIKGKKFNGTVPRDCRILRFTSTLTDQTHPEGEQFNYSPPGYGKIGNLFHSVASSCLKVTTTICH